MGRRHYYCRIHTNGGDWYGRFDDRGYRDAFCDQTHVWVLSHPHRDWRGNLTGTRERVPATIVPVSAATVRKNADWLLVRDY